VRRRNLGELPNTFGEANSDDQESHICRARDDDALCTHTVPVETLLEVIMNFATPPEQCRGSLAAATRTSGRFATCLYWRNGATARCLASAPLHHILGGALPGGDGPREMEALDGVNKHSIRR
jgi:hypothetical protein